MVGVNQGLVSNAAPPFGAVKHSEFGREGGFEGIEECIYRSSMRVSIMNGAEDMRYITQRERVKRHRKGVLQAALASGTYFLAETSGQIICLRRPVDQPNSRVFDRVTVFAQHYGLQRHICYFKMVFHHLA